MTSCWERLLKQVVQVDDALHLLVFYYDQRCDFAAFHVEEGFARQGVWGDGLGGGVHDGTCGG